MTMNQMKRDCNNLFESDKKEIKKGKKDRKKEKNKNSTAYYDLPRISNSLET